MVTDCFLPMMGGIEMVVSRLSQRLAARGHDVAVLTCTDAGDFSDAELPYEVHRSVWANPFHAPVDPRAPRRFAAAIRAWRPDVVHIHQGELTPVAQAVLWELRASDIPVVVTVHSVWSRGVTIPLYRAGARAGGLAHAGIGWTGVSELVCGRIRDAIGDVETRVVPNGVEASDWRRPRRDHDDVVLACATRFAPRKRVTALVDIIRSAVAEVGWSPLDGWADVDAAGGRRVRAVIAGVGPQQRQVARMVEDAGLRDVVELPGRLDADALADLYAGADIYVAPGVADASVLAAAEARAAGLAVVTRSQSGLAEQIIPGVNGESCDTDAEMAEVIAGWIADPDALARIVAHNATVVPENDYSHVLPAVEDVYRWAIGLRQPSSPLAV